jgi:hypothetical protein
MSVKSPDGVEVALDHILVTQVTGMIQAMIPLLHPNHPNPLEIDAFYYEVIAVNFAEKARMAREWAERFRDEQTRGTHEEARQ